MATEFELRGQLATCTRIFAMQGMIGVFGHVSVYQPEAKRIFITPGMGSDKGSLRAEDMVPIDLTGKPLEGEQGPPVEWPIHTALHGARIGRARGGAPAHALRDAFHHRQTQISTGHVARGDLRRRRAVIPGSPADHDPGAG